MYEDWTIEAEALPADGRIFCIASAGCTAFALANRGADVTAVDMNPAQAHYVRERLAGAPAQVGATERWLSRLRRVAPLVGWTPDLVRRFSALDDPAVQAQLWKNRFDTRRFRAALAVALRPAAIRIAHDSALAEITPDRFDRIIRTRLARGFAVHPNATNPYARSLLLGEISQPEPGPNAAITVECAEASAYLSASPAKTFEGFALSNVLDGVPDAERERLFAAVRHAAAPGAVMVLRSLGDARTAAEKERATRDRSLLWGSIVVERL